MAAPRACFLALDRSSGHTAKSKVLQRHWLGKQIVQERMSAAGMQEDYFQDCPGAGTHIIHGVAIVVPAATDFPLTPLTRLTAEQHAGAQVWDDTYSYFWDVVDVLPFRTGIVVTDSGVRRCTIFTLDAHSLETARAALAEQNDSWIDAHGCLQPTSAVTLPPVLVQLILQKPWFCIPLHHSTSFRTTSDLHKWRRKVTEAIRGEDRFRMDAAQAAIAQQLHDPPGEARAIAAAQGQCTHLGIAALLDMVRAWRGMLLGEDPWGGSEEEANFEEAISILTGLGNEISFAGDVAGKPRGFGNRRLPLQAGIPCQDRAPLRQRARYAEDARRVAPGHRPHLPAWLGRRFPSYAN